MTRRREETRTAWATEDREEKEPWCPPLAFNEIHGVLRAKEGFCRIWQREITDWKRRVWAADPTSKQLSRACLKDKDHPRDDVEDFGLTQEGWVSALLGLARAWAGFPLLWQFPHRQPWLAFLQGSLTIPLVSKLRNTLLVPSRRNTCSARRWHLYKNIFKRRIIRAIKYLILSNPWEFECIILEGNT